MPSELYASKHNGFINFKSVQDDPELPQKFVGLDQLYADLASANAPNYAHIVPNQCNDMHGLPAPDVPDDCRGGEAVVRRADAVVAQLVAAMQRSPVWTGPSNAAVVITWDEGGSALPGTPQGCCGSDKDSAANFGGGHIPTVVITNHGPRGRGDDTPYNHYSLLRTTEEALGIDEFLGHANDQALGVKAMTPLFAVPNLTVAGQSCAGALLPRPALRQSMRRQDQPQCPRAAHYAPVPTAGRRAITIDTAIRLGRYFGTSSELWINLQTRYDLDVADRTLRRRIEREISPRAA